MMQCKELFLAALEVLYERLDGSKLGSPKKFCHSLRGFQHFGDNEDGLSDVQSRVVKAAALTCS